MAKSTMREKVMLVSEGKTAPNGRFPGKPTGTIYTVYKNKRNTPDKLNLRKFDPRAWNETTQKAGMHVNFTEKKLPKSK